MKYTNLVLPQETILWPFAVRLLIEGQEDVDIAMMATGHWLPEIRSLIY